MTILDASLKPVPEGEKPLNYLFSGNMEAFYTTMYQDIPIYATKDSNDYYMAFVDISKINNMGEYLSNIEKWLNS